jgi:hypothetical protein
MLDYIASAYVLAECARIIAPTASFGGADCPPYIHASIGAATATRMDHAHSIALGCIT